jgi:hypothetical protein
MSDPCLIFFPNMKNCRQVLAELAPSFQSSEVLSALYNQIDPPRQHISHYHIVDTNFFDIKDLSWHMSLPQSQVALFIMS